VTIHLHHYPASLFSEKARAMLGYLGLPWRSVIIPSVMPRPLLMPLTGGYRRTPCLQIGANVYCDTAVIARGLARQSGDETLFAPGFVAERVAEWADTQLFRVAVALNFAPDAVGSMMSGLSPEEVQAFGRDRAELSKGASMQRLSPRGARAYLDAYLARLEESLAEGDPYLFGDDPCIADFSLYHCLWFLKNNAINERLLRPFAAVGAWMGRMAAFGHGSVAESSGEEALADARSNEPVLPNLANAPPSGLALGERVRVTPVDYGLVPVEGTLRACSRDEIVLEREAPEVGRVMTHFPGPGFEIERADAAPPEGA
jgi:glutathione S-transferase